MTDTEMNEAIAEACGWEFVNNDWYQPDGLPANPN